MRSAWTTRMTSPVALVSMYYLGLRSSLPWCGSSLSRADTSSKCTKRPLGEQKINCKPHNHRERQRGQHVERQFSNHGPHPYLDTGGKRRRANQSSMQLLSPVAFVLLWLP